MSEPSIYQQVFDLFAASHWTQFSYSKCEYNEDKVCYCLVGGFEHVSKAEVRSTEMRDLLAPVLRQVSREHVEAFLERSAPYEYCYKPGAFEAARNGDFSVCPSLNHDLVVAWNDDVNRTRAEVLAVLRAADAAMTGESA